MDAQCQHCFAAIYRRSDISSWWHAAPAASLSSTPAPTDRVQEIEARLARSRSAASISRSANLACTDIEYLLARVRSLQADAERYRAALDSIAHPIAALQTEAMKSGKVVKGALAVALQNDPGYLRHLAERALAAHPLEAPANGQ